MKVNKKMINSSSEDFVWVFNGCTSKGIAGFPSGVFDTLELAECCIQSNKLSGTLTKYPIDALVYDYAISNGWYTQKKDYQKEPSFIQKFSSPYLEHYHYENGKEIW